MEEREGKGEKLEGGGGWVDLILTNEEDEQNDRELFLIFSLQSKSQHAVFHMFTSRIHTAITHIFTDNFYVTFFCLPLSMTLSTLPLYNYSAPSPTPPLPSPLPPPPPPSRPQTHNIRTLRVLCGSLHTAIGGLLPQDQQSVVAPSIRPITTSSVFNALVVGCFQSVPPTLLHHLPLPTPTHAKGVHLPSSLASWSRVRATVRQYLCDLLALVGHLQDTAMQCSVLKQLQTLSLYAVCFPKVVKKLNKVLVGKWSTGESHVQVLAFLCLRRLVLHQPHPALHLLLKVRESL